MHRPRRPGHRTLAQAALVAVSAATAAFGAVTPASAAPATPPSAQIVQNAVQVSWQHQQTGYWCGPAAIRITISARTPSLPSQSAIASYVGTTSAGTNRYQVRDGLNHYLGPGLYSVVNVSSPMSAAQKSAFWNQIHYNVDHGYATAVNIVTHAGGPRPPGYASSTNVDHWVVVYGYNSGNAVAVADPASGSPGFNSAGGYWMSFTTLTQIVPKAYVS